MIREVDFNSTRSDDVFDRGNTPSELVLRRGRGDWLRRGFVRGRRFSRGWSGSFGGRSGRLSPGLSRRRRSRLFGKRQIEFHDGLTTFLGGVGGGGGGVGVLVAGGGG